ncbi:phage terminase large subunit [Roseovarius confluentis]|uniref:phage terminase large subunit n=1 Tax=Roseovarius confluentis TaxID=1852027 RepID=UPI003C7D66B2
MGIEDAVRFPGDYGEGLRWLCCRETQKSLKESAKYLIEKKIGDLGLGGQFKIFREVIETPGDGLIVFTGLADHTAESVKSYENFHRAWIEEAQGVTDRSLTLLRPTIRAEGSEIWASWNPSRPTDAIDQLLRGDRKPPNATVVQALWSDNPWFPKELNDERENDLNLWPEKYGHIWQGEYATVLEGAYYARHLTEAQLAGRIGPLSTDDLLKTYAFWDLAGTSDKSDAVAIWIAQQRGDEIRVLDYYEAIGQPFDVHVGWLRKHWPDAFNVLPHDGHKHDTVYSVTPRGFLSDAGFGVHVVPNQGRGAALQRIDALRRIFPRLRFNDEKTKGGREALGWYHEKKDENRGIGLGPDHDWSSHAADAAGLLAIWFEMHGQETMQGPIRRKLKGVA